MLHFDALSFCVRALASLLMILFMSLCMCFVFETIRDMKFWEEMEREGKRDVEVENEKRNEFGTKMEGGGSG